MDKNKYFYVGRFADSGSQNSFYKVKGKKYGFKGFPNKSLAEYAHTVQSVLSKEDLAPRVHSPVCRIRIPNYFMSNNGESETHMVLSDWGYLTEIASYYSCKTSDEYCDGDCANDPGCANHDTIQNLISDIEGCGLEYVDAHTHNLGYVKRGKRKVLVVIDCGAESVSPIEDGFYPEVCWDGAEDMDCCCKKCEGKYNHV